ncbi:MAG: hypothetical protein IKY44_06000 [Clostridia bacterium]|nr:hypothetical protein [Clostridia bacterium]
MKRIFAFILVAAALALCLTGCNSGPDFEDAFEIRGIEYVKNELSTPERMDFAGLVSDDTLEVYEIGYEGDTVKEIYKTFYLNVEQYDQTQRESVKQAMEKSFAAAEEFSRFTISHELTDKYYVMKVSMIGLDSMSTLKDAVECGLIEYMPEDISVLTISDAESSLTAIGFIKR